MSNSRSTRYARMKQARRRDAIASYYRHKAAAELIPENENVFCSKIQADAVIIIKLRGQPQMQFSSYKDPWGGWTISPTLAGRKVQQVLINFNHLQSHAPTPDYFRPTRNLTNPNWKQITY